MNNDTILLCELHNGERGTVVKLGSGTGVAGRLAALGFTPGVNVAIERNPAHGPLIVSVLDTHIALGRRQASQVQVRRIRP